MTGKPSTVLDPVCGMRVYVATAEKDGLIAELEGRTYAFCRPSCRRAFLDQPDAYVAEAVQIVAVPAAITRRDRLGGSQTTPLEIDEGMRRWYESCSCCLSEAHPEIKAQLDAERAAAARPPVDPGICEVAEAHT